MSSSNSAALRSALARSCSTRRTVNACASNRRKRVWSGGSRSVRIAPIRCGPIRGVSRTAACARLNLLSLNAIRTSSYLVSSQPASPWGSWTRASGSSFWSLRYSGSMESPSTGPNG